MYCIAVWLTDIFLYISSLPSGVYLLTFFFLYIGFLCLQYPIGAIATSFIYLSCLLAPYIFSIYPCFVLPVCSILLSNLRDLHLCWISYDIFETSSEIIVASWKYWCIPITFALYILIALPVLAEPSVSLITSMASFSSFLVLS